MRRNPKSDLVRGVYAPTALSPYFRIYDRVLQRLQHAKFGSIAISHREAFSLDDRLR